MKRRTKNWVVRQGCGIELMSKLPVGKATLVLTDPPYANKYEDLYEKLAREAARILRPGGSLVTLCGHDQILRVGTAMSRHLRFWWPVGMLHTSLKRLPGKWVCIQGKPGLWFVNSRRFPNDTECPIDYMQGGGKDKRFHKWGQPVSWFAHWIERLSQPGNLIVDPFMGGGTTGIAALLSGRKFLGADIDPDCVKNSYERLAEVGH